MRSRAFERTPRAAGKLARARDRAPVHAPVQSRSHERTRACNRAHVRTLAHARARARMRTSSRALLWYRWRWVSPVACLETIKGRSEYGLVVLSERDNDSFSLSLVWELLSPIQAFISTESHKKVVEFGSALDCSDHHHQIQFHRYPTEARANFLTRKNLGVLQDCD